MVQDPSTGSGQAPSTSSGQALHGYLNVLKPPGLTSHDVVARVRRLTGVRRVGHTGTLDPAAAGVLPVAIGRATRTVASPAWEDKLYWADVCFGTSTDTDDADGQVVKSGPTDRLSRERIAVALRGFIGEVRQRPPSFSAVHLGGQRSYQLARRARAVAVTPLPNPPPQGGRGLIPSPSTGAGAPILSPSTGEGEGAGEIVALPERTVHVHAIAFVRWAPPVASLLIQCRSGTYIRCIARDLGEALGCPAHLSALVRLRVGPFEIGDAIDLDALETLAPGRGWQRLVWPVDITATVANAIIARASRAIDFGHGRPWRSSADCRLSSADVASGAASQSSIRSPQSASEVVRVYGEDGMFMGFAKPAGPGVWQPTLAIPSPVGDATSA